MPEVVLYATVNCPYCHRARRLLDRKGVAYEEVSLDREPHRWKEMEKHSRRNTVPQLFIDGKSIGGFDDMAELDFDGELDQLLGLVSD